jgi:hypothetical protein
MDSKYLVGLAVVLAIGIVALSLGGLENITGAFSNSVLSDRGNGISSGSFDFQVCYSYSSRDTEGCPFTIYSGTNDIVQQTGKNATLVQTPYPPIWKASIPGAVWIWNTSTVTDPSKEVSFSFLREFYWMGDAANQTIEIASDNSHMIYLNGWPVGFSLTGNNYAGTKTYSLRGALRQGRNVLNITVKNFKGDSTTNSAGLLYKIEIWRSDCAVLKKSIDGKAIYNFEDVKPGDKGTDVLCLMASGSDAWACLKVEDKQDKENGLIDPEKEAGDITPLKGELSKYINFFGWNDTNHNNQYDDGEVELFSGSFINNAPVFRIADSTNGKLLKGKTEYLGIFWCFGTINGIATHKLSCDGSSPLNNQAQTDILKADLAFSAIQVAINNANFRCSS